MALSPTNASARFDTSMSSMINDNDGDHVDDDDDNEENESIDGPPAVGDDEGTISTVDDDVTMSTVDDEGSASSFVEGFSDDEMDDDDEAPDDWKECTVDSIKLLLDDIDDNFMKELVTDVDVLDAKIANSKKEFQEKDHQRMTDAVKLFNLYAGVPFWQKFIGYVNKNRQNEVREILPWEVQHLIKLLCWLGVYNVSIETALSCPSAYERVTEQVTFMGGVARAKEILASMDIPDPKKHYGTSWDEPLTNVKDIEDLQEEMSKSCSAIALFFVLVMLALLAKVLYSQPR